MASSQCFIKAFLVNVYDLQQKLLSATVAIIYLWLLIALKTYIILQVGYKESKRDLYGTVNIYTVQKTLTWYT